MPKHISYIVNKLSGMRYIIYKIYYILKQISDMRYIISYNLYEISDITHNVSAFQNK